MPGPPAGARRLAVAVLSLVLLFGACVGSAAAAPVIRAPGLTGTAKRITTLPPTAPPPAELAARGTRPDILVDAAGTAHVVWNESPGDGPDVTVYCRVPRGAASCESVQRLVPTLTNSGPGNDPNLSADAGGPKVVSVNDQIVVLSHRYPYVVPKPGADRSEDDNTLYAWTSDDGGQSFSSPAVVGTADVTGDAAVFGPAESPAIAAISDTLTEGTRVAAIRSGSFTFGSALIGVGDARATGRLAVIGGRPVAAFENASGSIFVRRWSGAGTPDDPATWDAPQTIPGRSPSIAAVGDRLVLLSRGATTDGLQVQDLSGAGAPVALRGVTSGSQLDLAGSADGRATVVWSGAASPGGPGGIWKRSGPLETVGRASSSLVSTAGANQLAMDAAGDGGGMVVAEQGIGGPITLAGFGTRAPTGQPGLGARQGGGSLDPDVVSDCQRIVVGRVTTLLQEGCFLQASTGRAKVSEGPVDLNGLLIVPDAGVQIQIDPRARTLRTTGTVSVILRAKDIPDITLFRGVLNLDLRAPGGSLFEFTDAQFPMDLRGFPVKGDIDVQLTADGVRISVSLQLPPAFGGARGAAVIRASSGRGVQIESLAFRATNVFIGPVELRDLRVQYAGVPTSVDIGCLRPPKPVTAQADEWLGQVELGIPPRPSGANVCGSIRFRAGDFTGASFRLDLPYPGIVLYPGVSLLSIGAELELPPGPFTIGGGVRIGAIPAGQSALVNIDGSLQARFSDPVTFRGDVAVSISELQVGRGTFILSTDGYVSMTTAVGLDFEVFSVAGDVNGFVDGPRGEFALGGGVQFCYGGQDACIDAARVVVSTKGLAVCGPTGSPVAGGGYRWGGTPAIWFFDCEADDYEVADTRQAGVAQANQAGTGAFTVAPGQTAVSIRVEGQGGVPAVALVAPDGSRVVPAPAEAGGDVIAVPAADQNALFVGVRAPAAGAWRVEAEPGSVPIAQVATAEPVEPASVGQARVAGRGRTRDLVYGARIAPGQRIVVAERGRAGTRVLGALRDGRGRLRFTPGPGAGGNREIVALIAQDDLVREETTITRYRAPAPRRAGKATRVRVRRAGGRAIVTWRPGAGASAQVVRATISDGRVVTRVLGPRARRTVVGGVPRGERATVLVWGLTPDGRRGSRARVVLRG